jgi:hypothetical protein
MPKNQEDGGPSERGQARSGQRPAWNAALAPSHNVVRVGYQPLSLIPPPPLPPRKPASQPASRQAQVRSSVRVSIHRCWRCVFVACLVYAFLRLWMHVIFFGWPTRIKRA